MPSFLMPLLEGVAAGAVVAFVFFFLYSRTQRKGATRTLTAARSEAEQLVADASRKGAEARAAIVLEGKMETLRLREDLEKEFQKRKMKMIVSTSRFYAVTSIAQGDDIAWSTTAPDASVATTFNMFAETKAGEFFDFDAFITMFVDF